VGIRLRKKIRVAVENYVFTTGLNANRGQGDGFGDLGRMVWTGEVETYYKE
jgi:hypothetical protein